MGLVDESTDEAAASQASTIKLKQLITNHGTINSIYKTKKTTTANNLSIIMMANSTSVKNFDSACANRFIVHLLRYTTNDLDVDDDCFTRIPIDDSLEGSLTSPIANALVANLLAR